MTPLFVLLCAGTILPLVAALRLSQPLMPAQAPRNRAACALTALAAIAAVTNIITSAL